MALLVKENLKRELSVFDTENDELFEVIIAAVEDMWDRMTNRKWETAEHTDYYNSPEYNDVLFLNNFPVSTTAAFTLYDDPDWTWGSDALVAATNYRVDYTKGVIYYNGYFFSGKQSIKVTYTAGYTSATLPVSIKQVLVRQAAHWYKQATSQKWHVSSIALPSGGGTESYKLLQGNMLPDFIIMAEREMREIV